MDLINVLWIEDNPLQEALRVQELTERNPELKDKFSQDLYRYSVPAIHFDNDLKHCHQFFNLHVLQHPVEIKDFISMCLLLADKEGVTAFNKMKTVVPDIIVFDYHFGTNISINKGKGSIYYSPKIQPIRHLINPNFRFKEVFPELFSGMEFTLEKPESENYSDSDFLKEISKANSAAEIKIDDRNDLTKDDFGLLSAIEILRIFREYITVAIPATYNKKNVEDLSLHGKYFEWLNEYDFTISFDRKERGSKKWDFILKDAAKALRNKIEIYLGLGKVIISYSFLKQLSAEKSSSPGKFIFSGPYGNKCLPLDGLFLDIPEREREKEIRCWALQLMEIYSQKTGFTFEEYEKAAQVSDSLINSFRDNDKIDKRISLSELVVKRILNRLSSQEEQKLSSLMDYFDVTEDKIQAFCTSDTKRAENSELEKNCADYRDLKTGDHEVDRLIVLFCDLRLYRVYQDFYRKVKKEDKQFYLLNELLERPAYSELRAVLFPIAKNPLVLPEHQFYLPESYHKKDPFEAWDSHLTNHGMKKHHILPKSDYPANFSKAEKVICLSFCEEIQLHKDYYPTWLLKM